MVNGGLYGLIMNDFILIQVLSSADKADGLLSRGAMAKLLQSHKSRAIMKNGLDHISEFGALSQTSKSEILNHIDYLIERGCLNVGFWFFPNIQIPARKGWIVC